MESEVQPRINFDEAVIDDDGEIQIFETFNSDGEPVGYFISTKHNNTFFGPEYEGEFNFPRGMYGKSGQLERIGRMMMQGWSAHRISKVSGCSRNTVIKFRRVLEIITGKLFTCPCGRPIRHQGFCEWRISESPNRQKYLSGFKK